MKKHPIETKTVEISIGTKNRKRFLVPESKAIGVMALLDEYSDDNMKENSISSDELFNDIFKKHTKTGAILKGARLKENLTQVELAKKLGIEQPDLSKMENGTRAVGKVMAKRLGEVLNINYRVFL